MPRPPPRTVVQDARSGPVSLRGASWTLAEVRRPGQVCPTFSFRIGCRQFSASTLGRWPASAKGAFPVPKSNAALRLSSPDPERGPLFPFDIAALGLVSLRGVEPQPPAGHLVGRLPHQFSFGSRRCPVHTVIRATGDERCFPVQNSPNAGLPLRPGPGNPPPRCEAAASIYRAASTGPVTGKIVAFPSPGEADAVRCELFLFSRRTAPWTAPLR